MEICVVVENISKSYNGSPAIKDISFSIPEGEIFGLIGADGAGKTTLIKILNTLLRSDEGNAEVCGYDIRKEFLKIRKITGYMAGKFSLYGDLTVEENIKFFARVFNTSLSDNYDLIKDIYVLLEPFKKRKASDLSGGMKQKLALCCALIHKPKVLFLDEPTTGVDPVSRKEFWENLRKVSKSGITTIVSTPYMDEALLCDRIALMLEGRVLEINTPANIIASYPDAVINIKFSENSREHIKKLREKKEIESIYTFGDSVHLSCKKEMLDHVTQYLKENLSDDMAICKVSEPGIEDCFLYYMQRNNELSN